MCGLIGYVSKTKAGDAGVHVINQLQDQIDRGKEGFGVVEIMQDKITIQRATEITKATIDARLSKSSVMIFHHRYPTSTKNKMKQTHPFMIRHDELSNDYCIMHNGVIKNKDELFKEHTEEMGYIYSSFEAGEKYTHTTYSRLSDSFNDSEALAIEVARYFNGSAPEIRAQGDSAFMAIKIDKTTGMPIELLWGRDDGRTLDVLETEHGLLIASDISIIGAERIAEDTYEVLDLQKYFKSKAKSYKIYESVQQGELAFEQPPAPPAPSMGFGSIPARTSTPTETNSSTGGDKSSSGKTLRPYASDLDDDIETDEMLEDIDSGFNTNAYQTPRERAFETMGERICDDISSDIMLFFENLGYEDLDEDDAMVVANRLNDLLLEKVEIARSKVRPHFDDREAEELSRIACEEEAINDYAISHGADDDRTVKDLVNTKGSRDIPF